MWRCRENPELQTVIYRLYQIIRNNTQYPCLVQFLYNIAHFHIFFYENEDNVKNLIIPFNIMTRSGISAEIITMSYFFQNGAVMISLVNDSRF